MKTKSSNKIQYNKIEKRQYNAVRAFYCRHGANDEEFHISLRIAYEHGVDIGINEFKYVFDTVEFFDINRSLILESLIDKANSCKVELNEYIKNLSYFNDLTEREENELSSLLFNRDFILSVLLDNFEAKSKLEILSEITLKTSLTLFLLYIVANKYVRNNKTNNKK